MKKSDVFTIVLIVSISVTISYFITSSIFDGVAKEEAAVKTVEAVLPGVEEPDPEVFNSNSINPTVEVHIGSESE